MNSLNHIRSLFFLFFCLSSAWSQDPVHYNLNDENGLPSNEVYQVLQDKQGFIWIGCDAGLFKYDGFEYKQYKNEDQNGRAISDLNLDVKGRVWARNFNGEIYCLINDRLQLVTKYLKTNVAHAEFALDEKGNCWAVFNSTVYSIEPSGKIVYKQKIYFKNKPLGQINDVIFQNEKLVLADRFNSVFVFNPKSKQLKEIDKGHLTPERNIFFRQGKKLMLLSESTLNNKITLNEILSTKTRLQQTILLTPTNSRLYIIPQISQTENWICTANGVGKFSSNVTSLDELSRNFKGYSVSHIMKDTEGNYWISTLNQGIIIVPNWSITRIDERNFSLPENHITALKAINKNQVIIGTYTGRLFMLTISPRKIEEIKSNTNQKTISVKYIHPFKNQFIASHGPLSVFTTKNIIASYPIYSSKDAVLNEDSLYFIFSERFGAIHLNDLRPELKIKTREGGGRTICYNPKDKTIYFSFSKGLFSMKNGHLKSIHLKDEPVFVSSLSVNDGIVYCASLSKGLLVLQDSKILKHFSEDNSIIENELRIVHSYNRFCWVSSREKLYRINLATDELAAFSYLNGINPRDINAIDNGGNYIFIATNKGLIYFPETLKWKNTQAPKLYINYVLIEGKKQTNLSKIILPFNNHNFSVDLSSISFRSRGNYTYRYRLSGLNDKWTSIPANNRQITFSHLPSGTYTFEVQAVNENGICSETRSFPITIEQALWETWWFYVLVTLLFIVIIALIFYSRLKYLKRKADLKNKLVGSQLTALKSQMNPHFMFNALNSIQDLMLHKDTKGSNLYISKFSNLMRKVLNASDQSSITLQEEIEILSLYLDLEKLRFGNEFTFELNLDETIDPYSVTLPSMILQPFVENAIKHGLLHKKGEKKLSIQFILQEQLICEITDNGIGRKHAEEIKSRQNRNASFATSATEKRIELLNSFDRVNYKFEIIDLIENGQAAGTKVRISLPKD